MSNSRSYYLSFLQQHLEEVGDFQARYRRLLRARHVHWNQLAKWEERHQLHLEALRFSRESSLELARPFLDSEWEEEVFGGAATLLVCGEIEPVLGALVGTVAAPLREALLDALFWHTGSGLASRIWSLVESSTEPKLRAELLLLLGRRREYAPAILQRAIQDEQPEVRAASLLVGAWLAPSVVQPFLHRALATPALEQAALLALLELEPRRCISLVRSCVRAGRHIEILLPALAAIGEAGDFELLQELLGGPHEPLALLAMGFHGSPKALPVLASTLENGGSRRSLSAALEAYSLMSGWEPDPVLFPEAEEDVTDDGEVLDEDEQSDRLERDARRDELRARALDHWQSNSRCEFTGRRMRHGESWSLSRSLRDLELLGGMLRTWMFRELVLHTGQPALADPESFHTQQVKALQHWARKIG